MPDLDLSALSEGPVGPLAPYADVLTRGNQRRRRNRVVAGTAALALVLGGAAIAAELPGRTAGSSTVVPAVTPSDDASAAPSPASKALAGGVAPALLLTPADAEAVAGGTWQAAPDRVEAGWFGTCGNAPLATVEEETFRNLVGIDVAVVEVRAARLAGAQGELDRVRDAVAACPSYTSKPDGEHSEYTLLPAPADDAVAVRHQHLDCTACTPGYDFLDVVVVRGDVGAWLRLPYDQKANLDAWVSAARERLANAG